MTRSLIQKGAKKVRVTNVKARIDYDIHGEHKVVNATAHPSTITKTKRGIGRTKRQHLYHMTMRIYGRASKAGKIKENHRCWVHCSCPYFRYYLEVSLAARGSSSVVTSTGAFPKVRNPGMRPHLCKHLIAMTTPATTAPAKPTKPTTIDDRELDKLVRLLKPFIPKKA